ncbi:MAG: DUF5131 family protein [Cyanobacteria bacterium P01_F01_bin.153]
MTKIEWTDKTINPIVGCSHAGPGCSNCYAEKMAGRLAHVNNSGTAHYRQVVKGGRWTGKTAYFLTDSAKKVLAMRKPQAVFVNSMGDWFHPSVSDELRLQCFQMLAAHDHHQYQLLTKRPQEMERFFVDHYPYPNFQPHLILGASICTNSEMKSLGHLRSLQIVGQNTFASFEPWLSDSFDVSPDQIRVSLDWGIIGGESGPGARQFHQRALEQCIQVFKDAEVPLFVKQMGRYGPSSLPFEEWPSSWQIRQFPQCMRSVRSEVMGAII